MAISMLTVRIEFDKENCPKIVNDLFEHVLDGRPSEYEDGYVVTATAWDDPLARLEKIEESLSNKN